MCWWAAKGGAGPGEGERPDDDDGGGRMAGRRGGDYGRGPLTPNEHGKWQVSQIKSGRGGELTCGLSTPHGLTMASWDDDDDTNTNTIQDIPDVAFAIVAVPISPTVEFRKVGKGADCDRRNSTTTMPLALPSSLEALPVLFFAFSTVCPRSHSPIWCSMLLLENGRQARSRHWWWWWRRSWWQSSLS